MCAILGWNGPMPPSLLHQLLVAAEYRGRDSTGFAFHDPEHDKVTIVKQAVPATMFVRSNRNWLAAAQRCGAGIGHVRKASRGMPIDNQNAHPFQYRNTAFVHNGALTNWQVLRDDYKIRAETGGDVFNSAYADSVTTDSMMLGPHLAQLKFSALRGAFAIAWMTKQVVRVARSKKELTGAIIKWHTPKVRPSTPLILAATNWEIIDRALKALQGITFDATEIILEENALYELREDNIYHVRDLDFSAHNEVDAHSSQPT